ncbi:shikimate dehydrogenase [Ruminococcaceae bacterium OttesenSCG-928-L11]|nr:shikimate dehydrogenase [Ruminococcaceae bacterium OttesenSCG-928-L11]
MNNIVLIGLPGSGKTTLGWELARRLGRPFVDTDEWITRSAGTTVERLFAGYGEPFFRRVEAEAIGRAVGVESAVIATGGGAVLDADNRQALRNNGLVLFLDRPPAAIAADIEIAHRPLLKAGVERLYALDKSRRQLYKTCAHVVTDNSGPPRETLAALEMAALTWKATGFAVIGDPIGHSLSPRLHAAAFAAQGRAETYTAIHVPRGRLGEFVQAARQSGLRGFNATIPHKQDLLPLLDEVDREAALCGAVNTVTLRNGQLRGYNTDMEGLAMALQAAGTGYRDRRVVLLGTGGAATGIACKAALDGAAHLTVLGRRPEQAAAIRTALAEWSECEVSIGDMSSSSLTAAASRADLLINATPMGMQGIPDEFPTLSFVAALPAHALVCDLIYNPPCTALLREAAKRGLSTVNGLPMLMHQGLLAQQHFLDAALDLQRLYPAVEAAVKSTLTQEKGEAV